MPNRTPSPGDVYRDDRGRLGLFVRTETRGGLSVQTGADSETPEHLLVVASPETRHFATRWLRADQPLPETLELVVNGGAEARIAELEAEVEKLKAERAGLVEALKVAVGALPLQVATHVRRIYQEARGRQLTRTST